MTVEVIDSIQESKIPIHVLIETLWTMQRETAFEAFLKTGVLRANPTHLAFNDEFQYAYDWMVCQMRRRIGPAPIGVQYPVWAWYQWEGERKCRDLRQSGYAKRGTPMVQITFEADTSEFLLSDFDDWHIVLNNCYLTDNEQDWDDFYATNGDQWPAEIIGSWDKVFDLSRYTPDWDTEPSRRTIQATLWEVHMSQVKKVEHFIAK